MSKPRFVAREQQQEKIRHFCQRATDTGGILLVSGGRGLGKTRLVDEALNRRGALHNSLMLRAIFRKPRTRIARFFAPLNKKPNFFDLVFGDVSDSKRELVTREPNKVQRHIIKIDVDPYFPYADEKSDEKSDEKKTDKTSPQLEPDENTLSVALIHNIVIALTSVLDCRCSQRTYGKTLSAKLGFWKYWFSNNAILWRKNRYMYFWVLLFFPLLIAILIACALPSLPLLFHIIYSLSPIIAWGFLRWHDWRALHIMSEKLYALVHADTSGEKRNHIEESKQNKLLIPALIVSLIIVLLPSNSNVQGMLSFFNPSLAEIAETARTILAMTLALGITWVSTRKTQKHAEFNQKNPVWMITLLKRYLYLCHRCGLEPILVFDELDKLEDMSVWWQDLHKTEADRSAAEKNKPVKLDRFLLTLARLKSSLGAEFLWILIGGSNFYSRLQHDRHSRKDGTLGLLATTIHQEVLVGPISFEAAIKLDLKVQEKYGPPLSVHTSSYTLSSYTSSAYTSSVCRSSSLAEQETKTLWLKSYGNLSTLFRNDEKQYYGYNKKTEQLANKLSEIWDIEIQKDYIDLTNDEVWLEKLELDWVQNWIHAGMMVFANQLLKEPIRQSELRNLLYENWPDSLQDPTDVDADPVITALQTEHSALLMTLGKTLLAAYLTDEECLHEENSSGTRLEYIELRF